VPRRVAVPLALTAIATLAGVAASAAPQPQTVTMSGRAYVFNHSEQGIAGATIRVRELPRLSAVTDANGDYELILPDDENVTPYIEPPDGYNQIDLQTFHARGKPIRNANFQTPADTEYNGLAALLDVPLRPDGRPEQCVIVTTASARNVRGVDFETFRERTPHGVAGATAHAEPGLPDPIYFNDQVIPDRSRTETSGDGGIIWTEVPKGTYRVITESPSTRFASFLATCKPGRIVNANPPWGAYELAGKEEPLGAGIVAGAVDLVGRRPGAGSAGGHVVIPVPVNLAEALKAKIALRQGGRAAGRTRTVTFTPPRDKLPFRVSRGADAGKAKLSVTLTDAAGDSVTERFDVRLPPPPGR
jgi:hypothetical protein